MYRRFISFRYIRKRLTAAFAIIAVALGVWALLVTLSIMEGYIDELQTMIREQESDLVVRGGGDLGLCDFDAIEERLRSVPEIAASAPFIETLAMYRSGRFNPAYLRGIDPEREIRATRMGHFLLRPAELQAILAAGRGADDLVSFRQETEKRSREVLDDPDREPLSAEEASRLFSRAWRREVFERSHPALRGQFSRHGYSAIVVGLQFLLDRNLDVGQVVHILAAEPGSAEPISGKFLVTGAFKTGDYKADSNVFLVGLSRMQSFLGAYAGPQQSLSCFDGLRIALHDHRDSDRIKAGVQSLLESMPPQTRSFDARVLTWKELRPIFVEAVRIEKWIMGIVLSLLNIFTSCIILLMLVLIVIEKTRDAGVLLALGATGRGVLSIFLLNGLTISCIGAALGIALGVGTVFALNPLHEQIHALTGHRLFDPEVYRMDRIPAKIEIGEVLFSIAPAFIFGLLASLVPAVWATRMDPIKAIHNE